MSDREIENRSKRQLTQPRELYIAATPEDLAREAAARFAEAARFSVAERGRFAVALSGGSTPQRLYTLLAQTPFKEAIDWARIYVFFADERFVPPEHPESTLRLARETLLNHVPIPMGNVFAMPTVGDTPEASAEAYAETLHSFFAASPPVFDLILLGMGPDGHTASLFPGYTDYPGGVAAVHDSPKPPPVRITLTLEVLNASREVWFLVTGADKAETLQAVFAGTAPELPAARVRPSEGRLLWMVDLTAGTGLPAAGSVRSAPEFSSFSSPASDPAADSRWLR